MEREILEKIDLIFATALLEGRNILYEFEVYEILKIIGIAIPQYIFVKEPSEISRTTLKSLGSEIVVKIVSPEIAHKQKLGGVKIIKNWNPSFLREIMEEMEKEVLSHFPEAHKPEVKGFLLVEFLHYTPSLGNETMIGFREDGEFGPIMLVSKGGDDAEFFAKHYDPANIVLPPLNYEQSLAFANSLKITNKFKEAQKMESVTFIAEALTKISKLVSHYSSISAQSKYRIQSLDINPLVVTKDNKFIAIDGFGEFIATTPEEQTPKIDLKNLEMFFRPQNVAVIGVSSDLSKQNIAREITKLLHSIGQEQLYLVNPRGGTVEINKTPYPLYKNFAEIPAQIDLVVYAAPATSVPQFLEELGDKAKAVIIISGLPSQAKYSKFIAELDKVKPKGLRIIGPNCMGVFFAPDARTKGVNTLFIEEKRLEIKHSQQSNTALLTQSGALALTAVDQLTNSGVFKAVVSFGNQYDVKITDLVAYFAGDPEIDLISLYIEGLAPGEGRLFFKLAQRTQKPILVYKSGKTEAGAKAAASHTAAMSGDYEVFKAACLQAGVVLAEKLEDYYDYQRVFALLGKKKALGNRVAGVVNAGFEATIAADELQNLKPAILQAETVAKLHKMDQHGLVDLSTSFLDVTPMANDQIFTDYIEAILQDESVDSVFVGIVPHSNALKTTPDTCQDPDSMANFLIKLSKKYKKPLVVSVNGGRYYDDFVSIMEEGGLPVYTNIRAAIKSLDTFVSYHLNKT